MSSKFGQNFQLTFGIVTVERFEKRFSSILDWRINHQLKCEFHCTSTVAWCIFVLLRLTGLKRLTAVN